MIVVDANILIYALNQDSVFHHGAKRWLESALSGIETVGLSWTVLLAVLRLTTRPGVFTRPLPVQTAFEVVDEWLSQPSTIALEPTSRHSSVMRDLLLPLGTGGNLTSDAHLAALAIEHNAELYSTDGDFARFPRLRWRNPLS
jgi:toxin-antitoxin system PIN domain toxin